MYQRLLIIRSCSSSRLSPPRRRLPHGCEHFPASCSFGRLLSQLSTNCTTLPMTMSVSRKNTEVSATMISTMVVVIQTSFQVGHVTFDVSWRTSSMKWNGFFTGFTISPRSSQSPRGGAAQLYVLLLACCCNARAACRLHPNQRKPIAWQGRRVSNPRPSVLETDALPIELHPLRLGRPARERLHNAVRSPCHIFFLTKVPAGGRRPKTPELRPFCVVFQGDEPHPSALPFRRAGSCCAYSMMAVTTPAPTVRPPSRMAKRSFSSIAIGVISSIVTATLSPGITISVPSGSATTPVTSVVLK